MDCDNPTAKAPPRPAGITIRTPVHSPHSPLTPVGTPNIKPRSSESMHKISSTGQTIDIMILPRSADGKKSDEEIRQDKQEPEPPSIANGEQNQQEPDPLTITIGESDQKSITTDSIASLTASVGTVELPTPSTEKLSESMNLCFMTMAGYDGTGMTGAEFLKNLPEGVFACPFLQHGCHKIGDEMAVKLHIRDDRTFHLMLLCRAVIELKRLRVQMLQEKTERFNELASSLEFPTWVVKKYGDQFVFRIRNINQVIQHARKTSSNLLFSEPFETHRYGYKMTMMVAPYGDANVARQYLSVYVTLIKGDYDAILRWPFPHPMTFTAHASNSEDDLVQKFIPNPTPENLPFLGRPTTRNAAFGIQRFCKLMDVDKYSIQGDFFLSVHIDLSLLDAERTPRMPADDL